MRDRFPIFDVVYALTAAVLGVFLVLNIARHLLFEDALIVLRYARNLLEGTGFVFNPGERVLGVTTPLHTLMSTLWVALAERLPGSAATWQNGAGVFFLLVEGWLASRLARRLAAARWGSARAGDGAAHAAGLFTALLVVGPLHLSYLYFGMEVHLFSALVLLALDLLLGGADLSARREVALGLVLGAAFLTRYDAALLAGLIGLGLLAARRGSRPRRLPWRMTLAFFLVAAPWLIFARLYFGSILPNALSAKEGFVDIPSYLLQVFFYFKETIKRLCGLYLDVLPFPAVVETLKAGLSYLYLGVVLAGMAAAIRVDRRWLLVAVYPLLHVGVYAAIGSDPGFRWHYYVLAPLGALFFVLGAAELVAWSTRPIRRGRTPSPRLAVAACVLVALPIVGQLARSAVLSVHRPDPHTRQLAAIADWLAARYGEETSILQPSIGILGWRTRLRFVDHAGLVTPGLYFYDDQRSTPLAEVFAHYAPDLALLSTGQLARPGAVEALAAADYEILVDGLPPSAAPPFDAPLPYRLYRRVVATGDGAPP